MCKTLGRIRMWIGIVFMPIRIRIWIGIKIEIRSWFSIKTMPIFNTEYYVCLFCFFFIRLAACFFHHRASPVWPAPLRLQGQVRKGKEMDPGEEPERKEEERGTGRYFCPSWQERVCLTYGEESWKEYIILMCRVSCYRNDVSGVREFLFSLFTLLRV